MVTRRKGVVVLWLELVTILVATTGSPLKRNRRILNEPGDIPNLENTTLPFNKRQQIIYLLGKDSQSKRNEEPGRTLSMEKYAKELIPDGRVRMPNTTKLFVSEDFHRGKYKETAVNKGDGPPNLIKDVKTYSEADSRGVPASSSRQQQINAAVKKSESVQVIKELKPGKLSNGSNNGSQENFKRITYNLESINRKIPHNHFKLDKKSNEDSSSVLRKKDTFIKPVERMFDGEILPPAKPIEPNVFEVGQDDIKDSHTPRYREELSPHSGIDRTILYGERPGRWRHRHHYHHHHIRPPLMMERRPSMYYIPMYSGRSYAQMVQFAAPMQDINSAPEDDSRQQMTDNYGRQLVMMQPVLPIMSSSAAQQGVPLLPSQPVMQSSYVQHAAQQGVPLLPSQPVLQSSYVQQPAEDRSSVYPVPMATASQQPHQQVLYPLLTLPAVQQPQPQTQLVHQPAIEQGSKLEPLPRHSSDEPGHARSEVNEEDDPKPREYDDEEGYYNDRRDSRYDEDRYNEHSKDERINDRENERMNGRYFDDRDSYRDEEEREAERERLYREREYYDKSDDGYLDTRYDYNADENARTRSSQEPVPTANDDDDDDDDDEEEEENELEESERNLQDSREEPLPTEEGTSDIEREDNSPNVNNHMHNRESGGEHSVIRIPPFSSPYHGMHLPFNYPTHLYADTYSREQLLGPSVPVKERILPRFMNTAPRITPIESPGGEITEMSASEARFRERMRLELQAKDTIPKRFYSDLKEDGLKNVVLRLNGEPLENASELRSKIINGKIIQGKGKVIKSKGPMRIRVTHKGKGKNRIKYIDIISPKKYSITDSRSKIGRVPTVNGSNLKSLQKQKSKIHKKDNNAYKFHYFRAKDTSSMTNTTNNIKTHKSPKLIRNKSNRD